MKGLIVVRTGDEKPKVGDRILATAEVDIAEWAEETLGIHLWAAQRRMVEAILNGDQRIVGRRGGWSTAIRVARAWVEREK